MGLEQALMGHTASPRAQEWDVTRTCHAGSALVKHLVAGVVLWMAQDIVYRALSGAPWEHLQVGPMQHLPRAVLSKDQPGYTVMASTASAKHSRIAEAGILQLQESTQQFLF